MIDFVAEVSLKTGIVLDPVYTGKAVKGMVEEMTRNPQRFKGRKIVYLHTGIYTSTALLLFTMENSNWEKDKRMACVLFFQEEYLVPMMEGWTPH